MISITVDLFLFSFLAVWIKFDWNHDANLFSGVQAFINYNFSCTGFRARKTVLIARPCTWGAVDVKKQTCTILIIPCYGRRNCTKLLLTPWQLKQPPYVSPVYCPFIVDYTISVYWWLPSVLVQYAIYLHSSTTIFDKLEWEVVQRI